MDDFDMLSASPPAAGNGVGTEEDPAAAFLAQQESEIAGIENDEGFSILDSGEVPDSLTNNIEVEPDADADAVDAVDAVDAIDAVDGPVNGEIHEEVEESNGSFDTYAAISSADRLQAEPESLRKWREEQQERLEALDENSRTQEAEWKSKAKAELEEWHNRQNEQLEKTKVNNRAAEEAMVSELDEGNPGTEWERVARLCDFNPKSSKQAKDVSRMRSVLISLKQSPLVR
ncbi:clathrin light chain A-like isoform X3 [Conger conger]|uniref:clathrin light chain A-like isoform X3 n=1 Tax=Conger conger TaxID=82655 RepID=UPI002A59BC80|nr:clathrin light chain A-like isoform X3 [Conger conger]